MTFVSTSNFCLNVSTHWKIDVKYCNIPQISYSSIVNCCYCDPLRWFHNPSDPTSKANPKRGRAALPAEVDGPPGWDFTPRKHEICTLIPLCVYIYILCIYMYMYIDHSKYKDLLHLRMLRDVNYPCPYGFYDLGISSWSYWEWLKMQKY
jgi:hypothetical protein